MMEIRIALVDDNKRNLVSLSQQIRYFSEIRIVLKARNGRDFLEKMKSIAVEELPQVVLMDIEMPELNGIDTVSIAMELYPAIHFLMLTVFDDDEKIFNAIKAGAGGYLLKEEQPGKIIEYITQIIEIGSAPMSPSIARKALALLARSTCLEEGTKTDTGNSIQDSLSSREFEVLKLVAAGYDYRKIAAGLNLSSHTVRKHIANIYQKLQVNSKAQIIRLAHKNNWNN